jgi:hypothetical protein
MVLPWLRLAVAKTREKIVKPLFQANALFYFALTPKGSAAAGG